MAITRRSKVGGGPKTRKFISYRRLADSAGCIEMTRRVDRSTFQLEVIKMVDLSPHLAHTVAEGSSLS